MTKQAFTGARIFDGAEWHDRMALVVTDGKVEGLIAADSPTDAIRVPVDGAMIVPGFLDLQVNGAGGALLNDTPTVDAIRTICSTLIQFGCTGCLPTIVTDTVPKNEETIAAGIAAIHEGVPAFLGLHLEGPHLSVARKGAHDPSLIRPMEESDLQRLLAAKRALPTLLITVAVETVGPEQISRLAEAGIIVSVGHTDGTYAQVAAAAAAGASMATHLFNAQSQIGNREPGVVGAVLDLPGLNAGLIADGIHVHPTSIGIALRAKRGPGQIFLVSDAMSITGTDWTEFELTGRTVYRKDGAIRLGDGTLAGADLTMIEAIRYVHRTIGVPLDETLRMASLYPATAIRVESERGHLKRGARADFAVLTDDLAISSTWIAGEQAFAA